MTTAYHPSEYMYATARIRSMENRLLSFDDTCRLYDRQDSAAIFDALKKNGFSPVTREEGGTIDREETLLSALYDAYREIFQMVQNPEILSFLKMPYDCSNIKAVLKCKERGVSPDSMLFSCGTVPPGTISEAALSEEFGMLPPHMAKAAPEALEVFRRTRNPQSVDLILDRACFADMTENVNAGGILFFQRVLRRKIDLVNILSTIRLLRMGDREAGARLEEALCPGGALAFDFFRNAFASGEAKFFDALEYTDYIPFIVETNERGRSFSALETAADNCFINTIREAHYISSGIEIAGAYLYAFEYEVKNLRILLSGKDAGLPFERARERIRESYV